MKDYSTIIQSVSTEKSSRAQEKNRYTFVVAKDATKIDVKHAVKTIFGADVESVRTMLIPQKARLVKGNRLYIKRPVFKKAIVKLKGKTTIDPNKISSAKKPKK
ncbi:MAG: 50S ribosomal protein L23 [bacterium]|nr:50S ribosomal protein L23 [bacterium]